MIDIPDTFFSKDDQGNLLCPKCHQTTDSCECPDYDPQEIKLQKYRVQLKVDKFGRKGKVVTLICGLPVDDEYLSDLAKSIKSKTGSGGTYYQQEGVGVIEIQGNKHKSIKEILCKLGFDF